MAFDSIYVSLYCFCLWLRMSFLPDLQTVRLEQPSSSNLIIFSKYFMKMMHNNYPDKIHITQCSIVYQAFDCFPENKIFGWSLSTMWWLGTPTISGNQTQATLAPTRPPRKSNACPIGILGCVIIEFSLPFRSSFLLTNYNMGIYKGTTSSLIQEV